VYFAGDAARGSSSIAQSVIVSTSAEADSERRETAKTRYC